jgi:hypothetical protein
MELKWVWKETKVIRISKEPCTVQIMIDQKQLENVEHFSCLGRVITNDARDQIHDSYCKSTIQQEEHS